MNQTIEANIAKANELGGGENPVAYKTAKGWATVTKCRTRKTVTRKVGDDGKESAEETSETVVYLDTISGRKRVKLPEAEVVKLERKPVAEASQLQAADEGKPAPAPAGVPAGTAAPVTDDDQGDDEGDDE